MNRNDYLNLLKSHDDPVEWRYPNDMDHQKYMKEVFRFRQFVAQLEERLGQPLATAMDSGIQDASFHSELQVDGQFLRFSNFGGMVATTDDESIAPATLSIIKDLAERQVYVFIPHDLLEENYTGNNFGVSGIRDWWTRYFDYV